MLTLIRREQLQRNILYDPQRVEDRTAYLERVDDEIAYPERMDNIIGFFGFWNIITTNIMSYVCTEILFSL